jgi:hypothetical protein
VHVIGHDVVEQPLVVRDQQARRDSARERVHAIGDNLQRVDVETAVVSSRRLLRDQLAIWRISLRFFSPPGKSFDSPSAK